MLARFLSRFLPLSLAVCASPLASAQDGGQLRLLAANCANCHGTDGRSQGGMPVLSGANRTGMIEQLREFKSGKRPATVMHQISKGYTDAEIDALAAYFSSLKQ